MRQTGCEVTAVHTEETCMAISRHVQSATRPISLPPESAIPFSRLLRHTGSWWYYSKAGTTQLASFGFTDYNPWALAALAQWLSSVILCHGS